MSTAWQHLQLDVTISPKMGRGNLLTKTAEHFRSIAYTSCGPRATERAVQRCLTTISVFDDSLRFAYKPDMSNLNVTASLVHHISEQLNGSSKSVRCTFPSFSFTFGSVPWSLLLHKTRTVRLFQEFLIMAIRPLHQNRAEKIYTPNNSRVLQGAVPSYLFSTYMRDLSASYLGQLFKHADDVALYQAMSRPRISSTFPTICLLLMSFLFALI